MAAGSKFKKISWLIRILVWCNSLLPRKVNKFLLLLFRNMPTAFGMLIRYMLLKNICRSMGDNVAIFEGVIFDAPEMMDFGNNISINPFCYLAGEITIGDDVSIAHTTAIHSANHTWDDVSIPIRQNPIYTKRVFIEQDVWIACNCVILSGVTIGKRSVVAAGAVVNKSVEAHTVVGGNPAKYIKRI